MSNGEDTDIDRLRKIHYLGHWGGEWRTNTTLFISLWQNGRGISKTWSIHSWEYLTVSLLRSKSTFCLRLEKQLLIGIRLWPPHAQGRAQRMAARPLEKSRASLFSFLHSSVVFSSLLGTKNLSASHMGMQHARLMQVLSLPQEPTCQGQSM